MCTESRTQLSSAAVHFNIAARSKVPVPVDDAEAHDRPHGLSYRAMHIAATYRVDHMATCRSQREQPNAVGYTVLPVVAEHARPRLTRSPIEHSVRWATRLATFIPIVSLPAASEPLGRCEGEMRGRGCSERHERGQRSSALELHLAGTCSKYRHRALPHLPCR